MNPTSDGPGGTTDVRRPLSTDRIRTCIAALQLQALPPRGDGDEIAMLFDLGGIDRYQVVLSASGTVLAGEVSIATCFTIDRMSSFERVNWWNHHHRWPTAYLSLPSGLLRGHLNTECNEGITDASLTALCRRTICRLGFMVNWLLGQPDRGCAGARPVREALEWPLPDARQMQAWFDQSEGLE